MITLREFIIVILPIVLLCIGLTFLIAFIGIEYPAIGVLSMLLIAITCPVVLEIWFKFSSRWI
jgi:hypothetical protein